MSKQPRRTASLDNVASRAQDDRTHHLAGPFLPQTPLGSPTPDRNASPPPTLLKPRVHPLLRWAVEPAASLKLILAPIILYANWEMLRLVIPQEIPNPFGVLFLLSGRLDSSLDDVRYAKSPYDIVFLFYYILFFSFVRQSLGIYVSLPLAKYFGIKREAKVSRFAEQLYALVYFMTVSIWGYRIMRQLPTWWYRTEYFWIDYPHWDMKPELKRYYLMQFAYWCQQLIVLVLGLEKPRKDYTELVAHHMVTLWLVGWSYLLNLTHIGSAVYLSMDIPDAFLACSKLLNYIQWKTLKVYAFGIFFCMWSYFRHYLNLRILWSVCMEWFVYIPEEARTFSWTAGTYLTSWLRPLVFLPLVLLQFLNLFWYSLIIRIVARGMTSSAVDDERSEDEDDENDKTD